MNKMEVHVLIEQGNIRVYKCITKQQSKWIEREFKITSKSSLNRSNYVNEINKKKNVSRPTKPMQRLEKDSF